MPSSSGLSSTANPQPSKKRPRVREAVEIVGVDVPADAIHQALVETAIGAVRHPLLEMNVGSDPDAAVLLENRGDIFRELDFLGEGEITQ